MFSLDNRPGKKKKKKKTHSFLLMSALIVALQVTVLTCSPAAAQSAIEFQNARAKALAH